MVSLNTNVGSLNAERLLNLNSQSLALTQQRLSSGLRINQASDDPSGLGIVQQLTTEIRGDAAGGLNVSQGQSMIQSADSGLSQIADALQRMRELAVQANNSALSASEVSALDTEYQSLQTSIDGIANGVLFNGNVLLTGATGTVTFQSGSQQSQTATVDFSTDYRSTGSLALSGTDLTSTGNAQAAQTAVDAAVTTVTDGRTTLGATAQQLDGLKNALDATSVANQDARSRIQDTDVAAEVSSLVRQQLLAQSGASALSSANFAPQFVLSLLK